jgi:hypothetical protein
MPIVSCKTKAKDWNEIKNLLLKINNILKKRMMMMVNYLLGNRGHWGMTRVAWGRPLRAVVWLAVRSMCKWRVWVGLALARSIARPPFGPPASVTHSVASAKQIIEVEKKSFRERVCCTVPVRIQTSKLQLGPDHRASIKERGQWKRVVHVLPRPNMLLEGRWSIWDGSRP